MQSDAFPTPPIYSHHFQPRLAINAPESLLTSPEPQDGDINPTYLLHEIELLIAECSQKESQSFWLATDHIKIRHRVIESMRKVENLFLELAKEFTQDPEIISAVSEGLLYTKGDRANLNVPDFIKHSIC